MKKNFEKSFLFHLIGLFIVVLVVSFLSSYIATEGLTFEIGIVYFLVAVSAFGHLLTVLRRDVDESSLFLFLLADVPITYVLIRETGFSVSPFLVLYPLLSIGGAVTLSLPLGLTYLVAILIAQVFSIGFSVSIIGNSLATITTSALGLYVVKALAKSDEALEFSEGQRRRLENLQRAILANIPSGLVSVDSQNRVIQINSVVDDADL